jgi:lysophospholipid acyltransferase (LPLAT)-like uncharacterized protein
LRNGFVLRLVAFALRAHARSLRLTVENEEPLRAHLATGGRIVLASWHQRFYSGICYFGRYNPVIMISESRDGEMIARLAEYLGWRTVRGSSSHGGRAALAALVTALRDGPVAGHIVDGPRGPAGKIKPGIAVLAQRADARIVPVYVAYARAWQARSWDRFQVPRPWSSVLIRFGRLIEVPADLAGEAMDGWCADLDEEFTDEYARAVADVGGGPTAPR